MKKRKHHFSPNKFLLNGMMAMVLFLCLDSHSQDSSGQRGEILLQKAQQSLDSANSHLVKRMASEALAFFESEGNIQGKVKALILLGSAYLQEDHDSTFSYLNTAISLAQAHGLKHLEIDARAELGISYFRMPPPGSFTVETKSLATLLETLAMSKQLGYQEGTCKTLQLIAQLYRAIREDRLSIQRLHEALPLAPARWRGGILRAIGNSYRHLREFDSAEYYLNKALQDPDILYFAKLRTYESLCEYYYATGQYEKSAEAIEHSYQMARSIRYDLFVSWGLAMKARAIRFLNRKEEAIALLEEAKKIMIQRSDFIGHSMMELMEVEILLDLNRKEEALAHLEASLRSAYLSQNWPRKKASLSALADFFEKEKNFTKAFRYQKEYTHSLDSLLQSNFEKARLDVENSVRENEMDVLNMQQIMTQQDLRKKQNTRSAMLVFLLVAMAITGAIYWSRRRQILASEKLEEQNNVIREQTEELEASLSALSKAKTQVIYSGRMASMGQLISGIAHEINNPLNFVAGGMEALKYNREGLVQLLHSCKNTSAVSLEGMVNQTDLAYHKVAEDINHVKSIITSLNRFSSPQTGHTTFVSIEPLIGTALTLLNKKIRDNKVKVELHYAPEPRHLTGNPPQLSQVFFHVLDNALNSFEGSWRLRSIRIETIYTNTEATIVFTDTGKGIPASLHPRITDAFFTTRPNAIGLGLSISLEIIQKHQGTLSFVSEEGKGSSFRITIPLAS
jgi:signal transduction histidine kinase